MEIITLPKKVEYKPGKEKNEGEIIVHPCFPGYGVTIGNAIRRVLLSSLIGAAPMRVKIKGVNHEFMALPHLKEDILEFVLNLKMLRLKVYSDEPVKLELDVHGIKEITAADIKKNPDVEIANPELVLGNITDMAGSLYAEIIVGKGMGYEMIENRTQKESEIGWIEMDAVFTPVLKTGIHVENERVGKMTNWDKLVVSLVTDGTITPEEAFNRSVKILIDQFSALKIGESDNVDNVDKEKETAEVEEEIDDKEKNETIKAKKKK